MDCGAQLHQRCMNSTMVHRVSHQRIREFAFFSAQCRCDYRVLSGGWVGVGY